MMKRTVFVVLVFLVVFVTNSLAQYYSSALGLNGTALRSALHNIIDNHNAQAWPLWSHFYSTDVKTGSIVWDIYSDIPSGTPPYTFTLGTNQCGNYTGEGQCYNHEHSWPSTYFNDDLPMKSDLHHVFPTDGFVNNKRSNFPFGEVSGSISYSCDNGGKLGSSNTYIGYNLDVFEPIDAYKGDIARAYFYMSTRYYNEDAGWGNWIMANGANLSQDAVDLLLQWHQQDPVSLKEQNRNNEIFAIQGNRNPFVDYPIFADCIWGSANCTSLSAPTSEEGSMQIQVYPNPAIDKLILPVADRIISATCYDYLGRTYRLKETIGNEMVISSLNSGMYLLNVKWEHGETTLHRFTKR